MAIILPIHGNMRGRIGGNVYSHNKGGDYVRLGTIPTNPQTTRQQQTRSILGSLAAQWSSTLTVGQRSQWDTYAQNHPIKNSLGADIFITGLAWYVRANARLVDSGEAAIATAPVGQAPDALLTLSVDVSAINTIDVTFTATPTGAAEKLVVFTSLPVSPGSTPNLAQCRLAGYSAVAEASPFAGTLPVDFLPDVKIVAYVAVLSGEGLLSAFQQAVDIVDYV